MLLLNCLLPPVYLRTGIEGGGAGPPRAWPPLSPHVADAGPEPTTHPSTERTTTTHTAGTHTHPHTLTHAHTHMHILDCFFPFSHLPPFISPLPRPHTHTSHTLISHTCLTPHTHTSHTLTLTGKANKYTSLPCSCGRVILCRGSHTVHCLPIRHIQVGQVVVTSMDSSAASIPVRLPVTINSHVATLCVCLDYEDY